MTNEELVYLYQNGDNKALETLIEKNKGIIYKLANKFYIEGTNSIDREDLEQEGHIGLITAADKYKTDMDKHCKFITYSVYWIYQKMNRFIKVKSTNEETSLNIPIGEDGDTELLDYIEGVDYSFENVEEKLYNQQLRKELEEVMEQHNTLREREVLKLHYGWDNNKCMSLRDISEMFEVTPERVRQIEVRGFRKIRTCKWARIKAKEIYIQKKLRSIHSVLGTIESIRFAESYLRNVI